MQWWHMIYSAVFAESSVLAVMFFFALGGLVLAAFISWFIKNAGVYAALTAVVLGAFSLSHALGAASGVAVWMAFALLILFSGIIYLVLFASFLVWKAKRDQRRKRAKIERKLQFTLPDRDNAFVRARLNTVLQSPRDKEGTEDLQNEQCDSSAVCSIQEFRFLHARKLLQKLRAAPLSTADRLETEQILRLFGLYMQKDRLSASDLRAVNDAFAGLLKLSAKYAV